MDEHQGTAARRPRAWMSWSSGKDSVMALDAVRAGGDVEVTALLCTLNTDADRVTMHGVRRRLLEAQADRLGLPLVVVELPSPCPNQVYEARMADVLASARREHVDHIVFGDLFLEDVRAYREAQLANTGIAPLFPLWGRPTDRLAVEMIASGLRATLTCVDPVRVPGDVAGRPFDTALLSDLPSDVDPCGEHGEFHTFAWDGPGFRAPVGVEVGEVVERDGFVFCDLLPT